MISDPCTRYGIYAGCNEDCPVLLEGNCITAEENLFEHGLFSDDPEAYAEMLALYGLLPEVTPVKYITF